MSKPKPIGMSLDDFAAATIKSAKDYVDNEKDKEFRAFVEKVGRAKAIGILLSGLNNLDENPKR